MNILGLIDLPAYVVYPLLAVFLLIWHTRSKFSYWRKQGVPTPTIWPILGNFTVFFSKKELHEIDFENHNKFGKTFGICTPTENQLFISDPEDLKAVLVKDFEIFKNRREFDISDGIFTNFLTALKDEKWHMVRSVISPTFSGAKLKRMTECLIECSKLLSDCVEKISKNEKEFEVKKLFGAYALDVIANTAFRTKINSLEDPDNIFVKNAKKVFISSFTLKTLFIIIMPKLASKLGIPILDKTVSDFFSGVVKNIMMKRDNETQQPGDFLALLKESMKESRESGKSDGVGTEVAMTEELVVAQCVLFFAAGYDTTATTLSMTAYNLAMFPECQDKVFKEVDDVVARHGSITYDSIGEMPYLNAVIKETLRLYPSVTVLERSASANYKLGDIYLEKGTLVGISIYSIHHDPDNWPEPEKFDPERFMCDPKDISPYKYLPFGGGRRSCVAMRFALLEIKMALSFLLMKYRFVKCSKTKYPPKLKGIGLLRPEGVFLGVEHRS